MNNVMLIVDDADVNREVLRALFENTYEIMEADSGQEALDILQACNGNIDIVLLDLMMPGLSGFDLLQQRAGLDYFCRVPVVVVTASGAMEDQVRAFQLGASDFVAKPFVPDIVVSRVNNVMASNRRMLSLQQEAAKLKLKSELDEATGVFNKATTEFTINETLKTSGGRLHALLVIDIDNFKTVNDTSGHQVGDHVIKIIADLLAGKFRKSDIVGRVGGDEFCVLMTDIPSMSIAYKKVNEIVQVMRYKPNLTIPEYVTLSIGMASNQRLDTSYPQLFEKADSALYEAKQGGKAQYREYGVEPVCVENDIRPAVLLLSNNRSVCSTVRALMPEQLRLVEVLRMEDLDAVNENDRLHTVMVCVDVSEMEGDTTAYWEQLKAIPWVQMKNVFAICAEGRISQYMQALQGGVADMLTAPIDEVAFKRRTLRHMENSGIMVQE